jgi:hypothetical protein
MIMTGLKQSILVSVGLLGFSCFAVSGGGLVDGSQGPLHWRIEAAKKVFYPGEPIGLTIRVTNTGRQEEVLDFGCDGIEAISMEIHDQMGVVLAKQGHIERSGLGRIGRVTIPPGEERQKTIVVNQWCSTMLPPGDYRIVCQIDRLGRLSQRNNDEILAHDGQYEPIIRLPFDVTIVKTDPARFREILAKLAEVAFSKRVQTRQELIDRQIAREMLVFAQSDLAVRYQSRILKTSASTSLKIDAINSLVQSGTLEAAIGLVEIIEEADEAKARDPESQKYEDIKRDVIEGVYKLRDLNGPDVSAATERVAGKHPRPTRARPKPLD